MVCRLQYSRGAAAFIAAAGAASLAVLCATPLALGVAILAGTAVACATLEALHRVALLHGPRGVRALRLRRDGAIVVRHGDGSSAKGRVRPGSFVASWLTIVRWRAEGERRDRTFLLLPGMADGETLRKIRVILRWG